MDYHRTNLPAGIWLAAALAFSSGYPGIGSEPGHGRPIKIRLRLCQSGLANHAQGLA